MAIGFTPKHKEEYLLNDLTDEQFLVLALGAALKLGWKVNYMSAAGLVAYTDKGAFKFNAEVIIKVEEGVASIQSASTGNEMADMGRNKKTVNEFIGNLEELKSSFTPEELGAQYEKISQSFVPEEEDILKLPPPTAKEKFKDFLAIFRPIEGYYITPILLIINILIFVLMVIGGANFISPDSQSLLKWGANFRPMTLDGEWWRLLTSCFVHIGIFHLLMNMYALMYIGVLLEPHLGKTRFIAAYLLTGLTSSLASLWWHSYTVSAGASGAIFGLYGVFLAMLTTNFIEKSERKSLLTSISIFVVFNLVYGIQGGIDNAAHIGGLIGGIIIGYALTPGLSKPDNKILNSGTVGVLTVLVLGLSFAVYTKLPNDIGIYDAGMEKFATMESRALEIYDVRPDVSTEKYLQEVKNNGIDNWKKCIKLLDSFQELDLPESIVKRNRILKEYCELRLKSYEFMYKNSVEGGENYSEKMQEYTKLITAKIEELNNFNGK